MKVKIIGYERNAGFSKKKNANYDYHILHTQSVNPICKPGCAGYEVNTFPIAHDQGIIVTPPAPGETWELCYNRFGKIEDAYKVEG